MPVSIFSKIPNTILILQRKKRFAPVYFTIQIRKRLLKLYLRFKRIVHAESTFGYEITSSVPFLAVFAY